MLADTKAEQRNEMHPVRVFNENCGTVCNACVDSSQKQALSNILRVLCISGSCKHSNLQQEQTYQNKQQRTFFFFFSPKIKPIAKQTVSNLQMLIALLQFSMSNNITRKSPWKSTGVTPCSAQSRKCT